MARRVADHRGGEFLPQLEAGLRAHAAFLASGFPGIGNRILDALEVGAPFNLTAVDVWSGLQQVDPHAADDFRRRHGAPWAHDDRARFEFHRDQGRLAVLPLESVGKH